MGKSIKGAGVLGRVGRPPSRHCGPYKGLQIQIKPSGKIYYYLRQPGLPRLPLQVPPGITDTSPEFLAIYHRAVSGGIAPIAERVKGGTIAAALDLFRASPGYTIGKTGEMAPKSLEAQASYLCRFGAEFGSLPIASVTAEVLQRIADKLSPSVQRKWKQAIIRLFRFATKAGLIPSNPSLGLELAARVDSEGWLFWDDLQCGLYEAAYAEDSLERLAYALGHFIRREDLAKLTWQQVKTVTDRVTGESVEAIVFQPSKTSKKRIWAVVPLGAPVLRDVIRHHRRTDVPQVGPVLVRGGKGLTKDQLGDLVADAAEAAGIAGRQDDNGVHRRYTLHGLRKTCTCAMLAHGVETQQIISAMGWSGPEQIGVYGKRFDREITAVRGIARWAKSAQVAA